MKQASTKAAGHQLVGASAFALVAGDLLRQRGAAPGATIPPAAAATADVHHALTQHGGGQPGADLAYRVALADLAFKPHRRQLGARERTDDEERALADLVAPAVLPNHTADEVIGAIKRAHRAGRRRELPAVLHQLVEPEALQFLDLDCEITYEQAVVDGNEVQAMVLYDVDESDLELDQLHGSIDPLNWPACNECFASVEPVPGSYWETPHGYGLDVMEDFRVPGTAFRATTALSVTFVDAPATRMMAYDLSTTNHGDGTVVVDRGFARLLDLGATRRIEGLKVVHFGEDQIANWAGSFSCLWWGLGTVRTAKLCAERPRPSRQRMRDAAKVTSRGRKGGGRTSPAEAAADTDAADDASDAARAAAAPEGRAPSPGPLEQHVTAVGQHARTTATELLGLSRRTRRRWPLGEDVTDGKVTSDAIELFEHVTPLLATWIDLGLRGARQLYPSPASRPTPNEEAP